MASPSPAAVRLDVQGGIAVVHEQLVEDRLRDALGRWSSTRRRVGLLRPGKQMAIDTELRAGHIDAPEARRRRAALAREAQLFGAMDGAMKFVTVPIESR